METFVVCCASFIHQGKLFTEVSVLDVTLT